MLIQISSLVLLDLIIPPALSLDIGKKPHSLQNNSRRSDLHWIANIFKSWLLYFKIISCQKYLNYFLAKIQQCNTKYPKTKSVML